MTDKAHFNVAASIRQRLLNRIRATGEDANHVWSRYATERLLYRLSMSEHRSDVTVHGSSGRVHG